MSGLDFGRQGLKVKVEMLCKQRHSHDGTSSVVVVAAAAAAAATAAVVVNF